MHFEYFQETIVQEPHYEISKAVPWRGTVPSKKSAQERKGNEQAGGKITALAQMSLQESHFHREGFTTWEELSFQKTRFNMQFKNFSCMLEVGSTTCKTTATFGGEAYLSALANKNILA